jgi:hypothetical protein
MNKKNKWIGRKKEHEKNCMGNDTLTGVDYSGCEHCDNMWRTNAKGEDVLMSKAEKKAYFAKREKLGETWLNF